MKNKKINLLLMTALLAVQAVAYADDTNNDKPEAVDTVETSPEKAPQSWIWKNGRYVLAGAAVVGLGTAAYYNQEIINWINSLTPEQAKIEKAKLEQEIVADLKDVAQEVNDVDKKEEKIAKKQTTLEYLSSFFPSQPVAEPKVSDDWGPDYERSLKEDEAGRAEQEERARLRKEQRKQDSADYIRGQAALNNNPESLRGDRSVNNIEEEARRLNKAAQDPDYAAGLAAFNKKPFTFIHKDLETDERITRVGKKLRENAEIKATQKAEAEAKEARTKNGTVMIDGLRYDTGTQVAPGMVVYDRKDNPNDDETNSNKPVDKATENKRIAKIISRW